MIVITLISLGLAAAIIIGLAYSLDRAGIAADGPGSFGVPFVASDLPGQARGVQEEDLPRFVFRDRPWAPPADAPTPVKRIGRVSKVALG